jgi:hypothetical protein
VPKLTEVVDESSLMPDQEMGILAWVKEQLSGGGPRPLKPARKPRKVVGPVAEDVAVPEPRTLRITITRATNLPSRAHAGRINMAHSALGGGGGDALNRSQMVPLAATMGGGLADGRSSLARLPTVDPNAPIAGIDDVDLQPFVEVVFQGHAGVTPVGTGRDPVWNWQFEMNFVPPDNR